MFERMTDSARRCIVRAQEESRQLGHRYIGTEHLLLGLLDADMPTAAVLGAVGVGLTGARARIEQSLGPNMQQSSGHIPFTPRAKQVLEQSLRQAQRLGHQHIGPEHLLRALIEVREGVGAQTLVELGVDLDALAARADVLASSGREDNDDRVGVVRAMFATYAARDLPAAQRLLADDLVFTSPQDDHLDRATYLDRCFPTADRFASQTLLHVAEVGGDDVAVLYEYVLKDGSTWRNAEVITVRDGRIHEIQVFFGGRTR